MERMAEGTILGILLLLSLHQILDATLDVFAPSPQRAFFTNDTKLICSFSVDKQPLNPNFLAILWSFQGNVILRYDNKGFSSRDPRMTLDVESLKYGNASLHISNVTISDGGIYKCTVIYSPESKEKEISLEVLAKPVLSILNMKLQRNTENTLTCRVTEFFPPDIGITWYRDGEVLRNQFMKKTQMYKDGTYYVDSTVTITPTNDDQNQIYSCRVQHDSLQEPLQRDFQLIYEEIETSSNMATVVCILVLIIIFAVGIGFFLWQKYRKKDEGTFTLLDIVGPTKLIAGEEASLSCRASNCPEKTSVTWLEKRRGQVYEIPESHGGDKEEEERLMDTQYGVISCIEGPNFTSLLKFRPSVTNHKDVTFICRYSCGNKKKKKTFHCRAIYAKPQLLQPISQSLFVTGELKYLVTLEKFYPKNITIRWTHGVGEPQEILSSTEKFTDIPDGTYNVCSEVRIPEELLMNPQFKVRVTWEHESLDTPGYKDLSIRDPEYPWTPVVEEIQTPNIFPDTPVTLQCHISEYFPNAITVTWLRKSQNQEIREEIDNMVSKTITPRREADNTYSCTARLIISPILSVHQGAEYICRVDHPSLEKPIEKKTRKLIVMDEGTFTLMDIVGPTKLIAGEEASLSCRASNCPENTSVTWLEKRGGQVYEIPESHGGDKEEEERLMDTQYGVISCIEGPNFTSSLKFRPSVTNHKDVTFICRYSCGNKKKEKTFHCRDIYAKPQILQPISQSLIVSGELKYLVTLEKFYPKYITIRWTHGVGEPQESLSSTETFTDIPDGTYSVCSEVTIPEELLKDPEFRVRVTWEHESLDTPEYKDLSIRDSEYPWTPVVEEIQTPNIFPDTPVTLQCHISEYFPNAITVTLLRKRQIQELCEEIDNMVSKTITTSREADNTYSCTARLIISPILSVHQGAEYICRVDHPSLEKPIEKKTRKLIVMAKPQMVEPIEITMGDSSRVFFTLNLQKFYPEHIEIEWTYEYADKKSKMTCNNNSKKYEDLTHGVTSVCSIPMYVFDDLQTKVSVTWKHQSMDEPETRTLTLRDLPRPQVGEIMIPNLKEDIEASMTCDILGCPVDYLKVSWFRKENGTDLQPVMAPSFNDIYWASNRVMVQKDKTMFCQSYLRFTPSISRDQGAEFICIVEHPSLEKPIERRTGPIRIDPPHPQVGEINIPKQKEDDEI